MDSASAENMEHRGLKGNERVVPLMSFLKRHLPKAFAVGKGEAIDFRDNQSGELDLFIYDRHTAAPIQSLTDNILVPAEALYAVIEVKSVLTQDELIKCMKAAKKIRDLRPYKAKFLPAATKGRVHKDHYRCPYYVFAYKTNLGADKWAQKEFDRIKKAAEVANCDLDVIDRVFVLNNGIIHPASGLASTDRGAVGMFLDFYIHLINFLTRERGRRPSIDWMAYASPPKWIKLKP